MLRKPKLAHSKSSLESSPTELIPWLQSAIKQPGSDVQTKLRGNILHVLCESPKSLDREYVLLRLVNALLEPEAQTLLSEKFPEIYQLYFYSRLPGQKKPAWSSPIYLNRLERHLDQLVQASGDAEAVHQAVNELQQSKAQQSKTQQSDETASTIGHLDPTASAIVLSNVSLARRGDPDAIARYLSETLSALDIGVRVRIRAVPGKAHRAKQVVTARATSHPVSVDPGADLIARLWIFCKASYSPDPTLVATPTAQRLRDLNLTQFQDAVLTIKVEGEDDPDWRLRVDLTPPEDMLKEWARWGDLESITRLLNAALEPLEVTITSELKDATLHIVCNPLATGTTQASAKSASPTGGIDATEINHAIAALLDQLGPQGIHRAMIYGPSLDGVNPDWFERLELPAADSDELAEPTETLAQRGDLPAIVYCLTRCLNPDLDKQLATGGVRVQLLTKDKRLHVMVDGPLRPTRQAVAPTVLQFLQRHRLQNIDGIRIYGRRSGQKRPDWTHGFDFNARKRLVPEATPEFAASDSYLSDLIAPDESAQPELLPQVTAPFQASDLKGLVKEVGTQVTELTRQVLIQSHLFAAVSELPVDQPPLPPVRQSNRKVALVWGFVGLLLALQTDWIMGQIANPPQPPTAPVLIEPPRAKAPDNPMSAFEEELAELNWGQKEGGEDSAEEEPDGDGKFSNDDFSTSAINDTDLIGSPQQSFVSASSLLASSPYPSFKSRQLDEKLALYDQRVAEFGPPDVLVIGSSRALRGIDPAALKQALSSLGYEDMDVFNFGVNGSTAQVADLIVRELIQPYAPPKLVLWADGARAFNSGRVDVTFNAIKVSEGYQQLADGSLFPEALSADAAVEGRPENQPHWNNVAEQVTSYSNQADRHISRTVGQASASFADRDRVKLVFREGLSALLPDLSSPSNPNEKATAALDPTDLVDFDGFLSLSVRFNPATYYQDHARVAGAYDSDYDAFKIEGVQATALNNLIKHTQSQQVPLIFINTPLTDEYLDTSRLEAEQVFQRYMLQLAAARPGFFYRDFGQLWPERYDYFSDPSHLNRYGAYQVSHRLAQDPLIPWPEPN
ncbi:MAG: DUF1574 domain-containing protein [Cyanobacteria bacterium J06635_1]